MRWHDLRRQHCSLARTVSVIGDRWTLLVLRDCFLRVRRFEEFQASLGITRHVLADRLRKLVRAGVLTKVAYQARPQRYEYRLTERGLDLYPVVLAIVHWGDRHLAGRRGPPVLHEHKACGSTFHPVHVCSACGDPVSAREVRVRPGPGSGARSRPSAGPVSGAR